MAVQRKLGIYWGDSGIHLMELHKGIPQAVEFLSFSELESTHVVGVANRTQDFRLLDLLQKVLKKHSFSVNNACLSLPSRDIISRSFLIPWMKPEEVQGAVAFEARKYIPFPLEELIYSYFPSTTTRDGVKQIDIDLLAVRKITYEQYLNVLIQSGVNVVYSEPSALSILRALVYRKKVLDDKLTAVLATNIDGGEILVGSSSHVKFVRDFQIHVPDNVAHEELSNIYSAKLCNEVRMSLDFFSRQSTGQDVGRLIVLNASGDDRPFSLLTEDAGIPVQILRIRDFLDKETSSRDTGILPAFGVALSGGTVPQVMELDLSEGQSKKAEKEKAEKTKREWSPGFTKLFLIIGVVALSIIAIAVCWWWAKSQVDQKNAERMAAYQRLGTKAETPLENIVSKSEFLKKQLDSLSTVLFKSNVTRLLLYVVKIMPKYMWLESISLVCKDESDSPRGDSLPNKEKKKLTINDFYRIKVSYSMVLNGYLSLKNKNNEFAVVNQFLDDLISDPILKDYFKDIELKALRKHPLDTNTQATLFQIEMR